MWLKINRIDTLPGTPKTARFNPHTQNAPPHVARSEVLPLSSRPAKLRVGVIGLGRLWETRHRPALARMRDQFQVVAVYDQVARRAEMEAASLRCAVAGGVTALVERPDVDVIYMLSPQWFELFAARVACEVGKPIYCGIPVGGCDIESLAPIIQAAQTPFMPEFARRFYPATIRLRELLANELGPLRFVTGQTRSFGYDRYASPGPLNQLEPAPLALDPGVFLLDWCRSIFDAEPTAILASAASVLATSEQEPDFLSFTLDFSSGQSAQIALSRYHRNAWGDANRFLPSSGFQVFAERGAAWLEMPDHIQWADANGMRDERLPLQPSVGELLSDHFHRLVLGEPSLAPSINDALAVARLVRNLNQSIAENRKIHRDRDSLA
jgi:predicted dehydrogenase